MLDLVGVQMLQLNLIVLQQSLEEEMGRNHESTLVEGHKGHDVAIGQRWCILATGHQSLHRASPPVEKTTLDESLHAHIGDIGAVARLHGKQGWRNKNFAGGEKARTRDPSADNR